MEKLKLTRDGVEIGFLLNPRITPKGDVRADRVEFRLDRAPELSCSGMGEGAPAYPMYKPPAEFQLETEYPFSVRLAEWSSSETRDGILFILFPFLTKVQ